MNHGILYKLPPIPQVGTSGYLRHLALTHTYSIFRECPLQVIVGSEKTLYYIHPGVLSSCGSPALKARIDGPWKTNGASGIIDWTDFDEDTIECALSYLYVEDYSVCGRKDVGEQTEEENDGDRIGRAHAITMCTYLLF